ncbi:MAG: choice-of-anchor B family protein [Planctomycetota bacterium]|nr:MAG: choice-of-anchor B family protein [Planctomycetota bacterium]
MIRILPLLGPAVLAAAPAAPAQGNGITLLAKIKSYQEYNDVWGYTAPNGDEYAIVGTNTGTAFYDCSNPSAPVEVGFVPGPTSIWRDMKTYGHYAYIVTEGGGGVQIVDLANPANPVLVKTWGAQFWTHAHNIAIDTGAGRAYVCGTNNGMRVLDLSANPETPSLVDTYWSPYVHDLHVQNGQAHLAEIYDGRYRLVNVAGGGFPTRDSAITPGRFTHNTWASADDTLCVTTDEVNGGRIALYDVSNPNNIVLTDDWTVNPNSIVHNAFIVGDRVIASWYTEGVVVADISDPHAIQLVGSYDTSPYGPGTGFHGAWGVYPFAPSGILYVTDIEEGFHVLRVDGQALAIDHAPLANSRDENGPYPVTATITSLVGATIQAADLWWRVDGGAWRTTAMAPTGNPDEWSAGIPGQVSPAVVEYYLHASDDQGRAGWLPNTSFPGDDTFDFVVGEVHRILFADFDGPGGGGWTTGATVGVDDWDRGTPQGRSGVGSRHNGSAWYDPDAAFSGPNCWGNDLGLGASDGAYEPASSNWLESPPIDCSGMSNTKLQFQRWLTVEGAPYDAARIKVNGTVVWANPVGKAGEVYHILDSAWRQQTIDISALADGNPSVRIRFELETDALMQLGGWNLDDVAVISLRPVVPVDTITLTGPTSAAVGATPTYSIAGAPPLASWWLVRSFSAAGSLWQGHPFDLGTPFALAAAGTTDAAGAAVWTSPPLPPAAAGRTVFLEAAAGDGIDFYDSNLLTLTVQ